MANQKKIPIKIAVFNQKGGAGKTTTVFNMAGILAKAGYKVLTIDTDSQANLSTSLLVENMAEYDEQHGTLGEMLKHCITLKDIVQDPELINDAIIKAKICIKDKSPAKWRGIDIVPANSDLLDMPKLEDPDDENSGYVVLDAINRIRRTRKHGYDYDFILFDLPPHPGELTFNVLTASNYVLVPASVDCYSLSGYGDLLDSVKYLRDTGRNPNLDIIGVFCTMINSVTKYDREMYLDIKDTLQGKFIDTPVRMNSNAKLAASLGCPLCWLKKNAGITQDYINITETVLKRCGVLGEDEHLKNMEDKDTKSLKERLVR